MLEKALPVLKVMLTINEDMERLRADVHQLTGPLALVSERVAALEGRMDSLPAMVKGLVDHRLMAVSRRGKRNLPR